MRHSIKYISILLLFTLPYFGFAQKDSTKHDTTKAIVNKNELSTKGKFYIGAGLGYDGDNNTTNGPVLGSQTPVYNATIDYGVQYNITLGIAGAYQSVNYTDDSPAFAYTHKLTVSNFSVRVLYNLFNSRSVEVYSGLRFGSSFTKDDAISYKNQSTVTKSTTITGQGLIGLRLLWDFIGLHLEAGLGNAPYYVEGGLTFRI
ncbi:MAG TPA: hypothetical protein VN922_10385 [Bacteroidia bacterium]|nr:hypothetical protein [Bacteroidia bacterium]